MLRIPYFSVMLFALFLTCAATFADDKPANTALESSNASSTDTPSSDQTTDVTAASKTDDNTAESGKDAAATGNEEASSDKVEIRDVDKFFDETFNDLPDDLETAKKDGKQGILLMFEMEECPFCHRMKTTVLNRSDIQDYFKKHFRILSVDIEGDVELTDFHGQKTTQKDFALKEFRVRATPVFQFIGLDGEPLKNGRLTGATKDADEFMLLGQYIVEKKNEEMPFSKFKHEQSASSQADDSQG